MNYRIGATLGPATAEEYFWGSLLEAGVTDFRLNTDRIEQLNRKDRRVVEPGCSYPFVRYALS